MGESKYEVLNEKQVIGRETPQVSAQEDTLIQIKDKLESGVSVSGSVEVSNFPSDYPLPNKQVTTLKNKVRIMAWDGTQYQLIEGYEGEKNLTGDENGNLTEVSLKVIKEDGTTVTVKRTFTYDAQGNLTNISDWTIV